MDAREYEYVPTVQQKMNIIGMYRNAKKSFRDIPEGLIVVHLAFLEAFAQLATSCANDLRQSHLVNPGDPTRPEITIKSCSGEISTI